MTTCPACGGPLNLTLPGFRPASGTERAPLTPHLVHVLGMCPNPTCLAKVAARRPLARLS